MASAKKNQPISSEQPHFSPHSTAKTNSNLGKNGSIGKSDFAVYSEKTRMKKLMMMMKMIIINIIIIIMNKSQETTVFHGRQNLTSAMK